MIAPSPARRAARRPRGGGRTARAANEDFNVPPARGAAVMEPAVAAREGARLRKRPRAARPGGRPL